MLLLVSFHFLMFFEYIFVDIFTYYKMLRYFYLETSNSLHFKN